MIAATRRGAAVAAALFFLVLRGGIALLVGPLLGEPTPSLPLYLGSALLVEVVALTSLARRPLLFGAAAGLAVGSLGSAVEAGWSYLVMPLPWTPDVWVEGLLMAVPVGVAGGLVGALLALGVQGRLPRPSLSRPVLVASLLVLAAATTNGLLATVPDDRTASVALTPAGPGTVDAVVTLSQDVDDPAWLQITAWQGGGLVVDRLERTGPATYRSTVPLPVTGGWKTLLRLQDGRELTATPIFLPADEAIGAEEVPAVTATRPFTQEIEILQRERDLSVPGWTYAAASLFVLGCSIVLVLALAVGVARLSRRLRPADGGPAEPGSTPRRTADVHPVDA